MQKIDNLIMKKKQGFTLIELSISLAIISLIFVSISYGSTIINQASLRSVITEVRGLATAINNFKMLYGAIPGDLSVATNYWTATGLNNGNGNGIIDTPNAVNEYQSALQMLSLSGLIQKNISNGATYSSKYSSNASYQIFNHYTNNTNSAGISSNNVYGRSGSGNVLDLANISSNTFNGAIKPQDASDIDNKMDDGILYSGIVYTAKGADKASTSCSCTKGTTIYSAASSADSYVLNKTAPCVNGDSSYSCWMFFWVVDTLN